MIIRSDIMMDLGIDIMYSECCIQMEGKSVPLKKNGELSDGKYCKHVYNIHTDSLILKQTEEYQGRILDADYTKVDIDDMVKDLNIKRPIKRALKKTLKKFPDLSGGSPGLLDTRPVLIKLTEDSKSYQGRYYKIPKAYKNRPRRRLKD